MGAPNGGLDDARFVFGRSCAHHRMPETIDLVTAYLQVLLGDDRKIYIIQECLTGGELFEHHGGSSDRDRRAQRR